MSNIGKAQILRLTREQLATIKKFLPIRDAFRDNLQAQIATEICQRLFHGRIIDIGTYRNFVDELVDDFYSD